MACIKVSRKTKNYYLNIFRRELYNLANNKPTEYKWNHSVLGDGEYIFSTLVNNNIHLKVRKTNKILNFTLEFFVYSINSNEIYNDVEMVSTGNYTINYFHFKKIMFLIPHIYYNCNAIHRINTDSSRDELDFYKKSPVKYQRYSKLKKLNFF